MFIKFDKGVKITSIGHFLPENIVTNQQLLQGTNLPITDEWIKKRIGIETRHKISDGMFTSDMAIEAAKKAIAKAGIDASTIDLIILSTISPDNPSPATSCLVQSGLGISEYSCPCFDISAACSGFIYALDIASRHILTGAKRVLVVSAEVRSRLTNPKDPATYAIFGDAAAAAILEPCEKDDGLIAIEILTDGRGYFSVHIPAGGTRKPASAETVANNEHYIRMENGEQLFFEVVEAMTSYTNLFLEKCNISLEEIDFIIPHQANSFILKEVARRLNLPAGKMLVNFPYVGNTSSASIPMVLSEFTEKGIIKHGAKVLMVSVGAGNTMGLALMKV